MRNNQVNKYCAECRAYKLHTRGTKYYTCLTCCARTEKQANNRLHSDALQVYDAGEVNGVRLTVVNGMVFATPAKRR